MAFSVAAIHQYPTPLIVIDMRITIYHSLLRGNKGYRGVYYHARRSVSAEALSSAAAELPHISIETPESLLGHDTVDAMRSGVVYGNASMVDGMIDRLEAASEEQIATVVATGSAAPEILTHCTHPILYNADLLLDGLFLIYQKNSASRGKR